MIFLPWELETPSAEQNFQGSDEESENRDKKVLRCSSSGNNGDSAAQQLHQDFDLMKIVDDVQSALRAGVSIQVRNLRLCEVG